MFSRRKCLLIWGDASLDSLPSAPFIRFLCFLSGKEADEVFTFLRSVADLHASGQEGERGGGNLSGNKCEGDPAGAANGIQEADRRNPLRSGH